MRLAALAGVLAAAALGGCLGGGDGGARPDPTPAGGSPGPSATPTPSPTGPVRIPLLLDFSFRGCSGIRLVQAQPLADVQALLPEPFVAAPFRLDPALPSGDGALAVDLLVCANLTTPNTEVSATYYGQVYTLVERPGALVPDAPDPASHEYVFRVLAGEDVLAVLWPAAGYDTHNGSASVQLVGSPTPLRAAQATLGSYAAEGAGASSLAAPAALTAPFARYTRLADGSLLYWTGRYEFPAAFAGSGDWAVPDDDPFSPFRRATGTLGGVAWILESGAVLDGDLVQVRGT